MYSHYNEGYNPKMEKKECHMKKIWGREKISCLQFAVNTWGHTIEISIEIRQRA